MAAFRPVSPQVHFPDLEETVLALWRERDVFRQSVEGRSQESRYVFYDGPPFATGLPHYGHLVASTLKDIVPRYWAMRGHRVERRFGWDTHGLPIEMEMEKQLGLSGPGDIRAYGVAAFNEACRGGVLRYTAEWEKVVSRLGRWVDFQNDYKTMDPSFMESVWWVFRQLWDKGLIYADFRVMPFSWRLSTSLSNFEANMDYRDVQDPAITVTMPLLDAEESLLVWTTTPWTLPSNLAVAVGEEIEYVRARKAGEEAVYIIAAARAEAILGKGVEILDRFPGSQLVGRRYAPLFDYFADLADRPAGEGQAFVVIAAPHVTTADGTGLVHMAPDFGEEDFQACRAVGIGVLQSVDDEGRFVRDIKDFAGRNVKEADADIIRWLKDAGRLVRHDTIQHSYPFCWRSDTPLIYKAVPARFVRVEALRERMQAHNQTIHWVPEAVGQKRFGNWLADARDWNVSRNRFWGTPIPIWRCEGCGAERCIGSIAELEAATGAEVTDLHPHRIDHLTIACADCDGQARRIPDVFDCWFESGSMPYAQRHHPFEGADTFAADFPARFIAEGLDQTRGWFYTLHVLAAALFGRLAFKHVIVNGLVLAEDGKKMSKRLKNYPDPGEIIHQYGADALRAYLINSAAVRAEPMRFAERGVRDTVRKIVLPLQNAYNFLATYAQADGWEPSLDTLEHKPQTPLDRWILSRLQDFVGQMRAELSAYALSNLVPAFHRICDDLNNWYIRRGRRRYWREKGDSDGSESAAAEADDKAEAYATLFRALVTVTKAMAPVLPFFSEMLYQRLMVDTGLADGESVHFCAFPEPDAALRDAKLEDAVAHVRRTVAVAQALREKEGVAVRRPLPSLTVAVHTAGVAEALRHFEADVLGELNVKALELTRDDADLVTLRAKANFKTLGRRLGKKMKVVAKAIADLEQRTLRALAAGGTVEVEGETLSGDDILLVREPRAGRAVASDGDVTVMLDLEATPELVREGLAREVINRVQNLRKQANLDVSQRIVLFVDGPAEGLLAAAIADAAMRELVASETLSLEVVVGAIPEGIRDRAEDTIDGEALRLGLAPAYEDDDDDDADADEGDAAD
ncbi:MAG: isoleucine--tRNA ligase [Myxococcales bacterium]|nr:isoleucine--tRNA ligase [Myxococcales bacterium]